jgi:general stress protein CsbA
MKVTMHDIILCGLFALIMYIYMGWVAIILVVIFFVASDRLEVVFNNLSRSEKE